MCGACTVHAQAFPTLPLDLSGVRPSLTPLLSSVFGPFLAFVFQIIFLHKKAELETMWCTLLWNLKLGLTDVMRVMYKLSKTL